MKILITGGFGYIGGRLGEHLVSSGHEVYLGSRSPKSQPEWLKQGKVVQMDWSDQNNLTAACQNMDTIIHASGMNAVECHANPTMALEVNGFATQKLVQAAQRSCVSKFVYISTAHVYSSDLNGLITEYTEVSNEHPYATSHVTGEQAVINAHSDTAMHTCVVRLANSFGAPLDRSVNCWMLVANDFCKQAASDRRLVIRGPSNTVRNFITMTDVCSGLEYLLSADQYSSSPTICNLGDKEKSLIDIASAIQKIYLDDKEISLPIFELSKPVPVTNDLEFRSLVLEQFDWQPSSNFKTELYELIKFCELNYRSCNEN